LNNPVFYNNKAPCLLQSLTYIPWNHITGITVLYRGPFKMQDSSQILKSKMNQYYIKFCTIPQEEAMKFSLNPIDSRL
jgi:hypothetical protein